MTLTTINYNWTCIKEINGLCNGGIINTHLVYNNTLAVTFIACASSLALIWFLDKVFPTGKKVIKNGR